MSEQEPLDLSPLDPMQDPEHWQRVVAATLARVDEVLSRRHEDPLTTIAGWARPLLIAAAAAMALLVPLELALEARETEVEQVQRLVWLSVDWRGETPPSGTEFVRALTEEDEP